MRAAVGLGGYRHSVLGIIMIFVVSKPGRPSISDICTGVSLETGAVS